MDGITSGRFFGGNSATFAPLVDNLLSWDPFFVLADFDSYDTVHTQVSDAYRDTNAWGRMSLLNTARSGKFSSDRTIREYCRDIWKLPVS